MKKILAILTVIVMLAAMALAGAGCKSTSNDPKNLKVGFIYVGPVGDMGYSYAQDQGREYLKNTLGVQTFKIENVPETADCKASMEQLIKQGCKVIFATSFGYMDYVEQLAQKYPDVIFEHCSGSKMNDKNFGNYFGREYQARYLSGIAAGKATKTGKIGYVAAMKIAECIRGINAFTLGVRSVNPTATVSVVWTNKWMDPQLEKQAAESLLDQGCDVMAQHQDSATCVQAAEARGAFSVGYDSPMGKYAPNGYLTSPVWNWGPYFVKVVQEVIDGNYKPESYYGGIETGIIGLDAFGPSVSQETKDLIKTTQDKMSNHTWDVFTGPIKDQDGNVKIAEGAKYTDADLFAFDWFVEGVIGSPK